MTRINCLILLPLLVGLFAPQLVESIAVMSIDLGSEFMKIAIVKPGIPMEIVLNKESRRKTHLAVSLRGNEREFGENAISQAIKKPKTAYMYLTQILGKSLDNPAVVAYQKRFPYYDIREDPVTKTIYFQHDDDTTYTPEELLAMILDYARELAADFGEQSVDAAVIAVPPYFNQAERKAVLYAAQLANLKVLQLINTNVAAGLNYGVFRRKDFNSTGTSLMFFDMGSMGTTATIGTFQMVKSKDDYEANPQLVIRGVGFDRTLGGAAFTMRLADHLAAKFKETSKKDVHTNPKALLKIYKEADRLKTVLSANADHMAQIESLMDDVDFKLKVTRAEFENMCADLFARVKKTVEDAFATSEMQNDDVSVVILVGAGTRIPKIQEELLLATKKSELGKNLNTDEAIVMGAVYQAAYASKGYKVKKFYTKDLNIYPIVVDFEKFNEDPKVTLTPAPDSHVRRVLFDRSNPYPQKKVLTFNKHTDDFSFNINYGDLSFLSVDSQKTMGSMNLSEIKLAGIKDMYAKHESEESKGVKVHFKLDESGIVKLDKIDASFEKIETLTESTTEESTFTKIGKGISSFFGGKSDGETATEESDEPSGSGGDEKKEGEEAKDEKTNESTPPTVNATDSAAGVNETFATNATTPATPANTTTVTREVIKFEHVHLDVAEVDKKAMDASRAKLLNIKEKEKEKRKRALAINALETMIFDVKDKLEQDEFVKCSKESERVTIKGVVDELSAWLDDADDSVETKTFNEKLSELKSATKEVNMRIAEHKHRPRRLGELKDVLNRSVEFLKNVQNLTGTDLPLTETEFNTLDKLINSTKEWRTKMVAEQAAVPDNETPKLFAADIGDKIDALKREVGYLVNKVKNFRPKTTKKPPVVKKPKTNDTTNGTVIEESVEEQAPVGDDATKSDEFENMFDDAAKEEAKDEAKANEGGEETTPTSEEKSTHQPEL